VTALLVFDAETTDLDTTRATLLEAAWCVTNLDGSQRLPIRQRYCAVTATDTPVHPIAPHTTYTDRWSSYEFGNRVALRMAKESGLYADWLAQPPSVIVRSAVELERLMLDDIATVCTRGVPNPAFYAPRFELAPTEEDEPGPWLVAPERVHIAGMGVAQFDQSLLRQLCPRLVGPPLAVGATHYRTVDVSGTQTALLGGAEEGQLIQWGCQEYGWSEINHFEFAPVPHCNYEPPKDDWLIGETKPHRAALDVCRGIAAQRVLWRHAEPLRRAIYGADAA